MTGRVLCITSNFPRWAGDSTTPFVLHLAEDLQDLGWQIHVLAPHAPGAALREILNGVEVARFRYLWPAGLETVCYQGGALMNLRKHRSNFLKLPALVAAEWFSVLRHLRVHQYDLLHSHWILPQGFTGALANGALKIPHVTTAHGSDVFALRNSLLKPFKRYALHSADAVTANSSATRRELRKIVPELPVEEIPIGVSTGAPNVAAAAKIRHRFRRGNGPLVVSIGRVVLEKGIADLLHAISVLVRRLPDATALVVGEGQDRSMLEKMAHDLNISDHVSFIGWTEPERVPDYLAAADIFVGLSWFEAQGLAVAEALLAKKPVIATAVGGILDAVLHEQTGLLVQKSAPEEAAAAVERLVREPDLAKRLATTGFALAQKRFTRAASASAFSALFTRLIDEKKQHPA